MKIFLIFLFTIGNLIADDNSTTSIVSSNSNVVLPVEGDNIVDKDSNATLLNQNSSKLPNIDDQNKEENLDEKLKNDIITFNRIDYINKNTNIQDPFIYIYPQTDDDLAYTTKVEQAVLVLKGIFENRANINSQWVEKGGNVEGWSVVDIQKNQVKLEFRNKKKTLEVVPEKINIKKEVKYE
ncbi:hypothetical protein [Helicobacter sp. MIT 14-3879]|uniref:hypothetical protein n=1 Tax=Helicobacter sp. MIT 14-3879 TaxID=2040649 RepID=UPI000E1F1A84|nr:hypothetical protein [Helicobacter sp. MIT 14-3879]RDU65221.1 hypothetical protein CQA44_02595 [Helicobacter sp. MIT 14-3879]